MSAWNSTRGAQIVEWLPVVALASSLTMCGVKICQMDGAASDALRFAARTTFATGSLELGIPIAAARGTAAAARGLFATLSHPVVTMKALVRASTHPFETIFKGALTAHSMTSEARVIVPSAPAPAVVTWADRWIAPVLLPPLVR